LAGPWPCTLRNQIGVTLTRITPSPSPTSLHPSSTSPSSLLTLHSISIHLLSFVVIADSHILSSQPTRIFFLFFSALLSLIANMKAPFIAAAALLAGGASAEVHKLKLNKVPLEEQLVSLKYLSF